MVTVVKGIKLPHIGKSWDVMNSMLTTVNTTVWYI